MQMTGKNLVCKKCQRVLGRIIDDVYLVIGEARFYDSVRFSCRCGKAVRFTPISFDDRSGFEGETKRLLNELGLDKKYYKKYHKQREK